MIMLYRFCNNPFCTENVDIIALEDNFKYFILNNSRPNEKIINYEYLCN